MGQMRMMSDHHLCFEKEINDTNKKQLFGNFFQMAVFLQKINCFSF